jgi:hypothetical protein
MTIRMRPVLECSVDSFLPLSGEMEVRDVDRAVAVLARYLNADGDDEDGDDKGDVGEAAAQGANRARTLRRLLDLDGWVAPGGLQIHDLESGVSFTPGCCCGLESWREWLAVRNGREIWLGHDPTAEIEHTGTQIRLRWETGTQGGAHSIEFPRADLTALLLGVQQDLGGFLNGLATWADVYLPDLAEDLVARFVTRFDEEFAVTARLEF